MYDEPTDAPGGRDPRTDILAVRDEVANRITGTAHAPRRHPSRRQSAAAPAATMPPYSTPVRLTQASAWSRSSGKGTMNQLATSPADCGYHACIVNAWAGVAAAIACSRNQSAG